MTKQRPPIWKILDPPLVSEIHQNRVSISNDKLFYTISINYLETVKDSEIKLSEGTSQVTPTKESTRGFPVGGAANPKRGYFDQFPFKNLKLKANRRPALLIRRYQSNKSDQTGIIKKRFFAESTVITKQKILTFVILQHVHVSQESSLHHHNVKILQFLKLKIHW